MRRNLKGFTLIELMVVISIIGLLVSVVIAYVGQTRRKADDTAIRTLVEGAALKIGTYFEQKGTYDGVCTSDISVSLDRAREIYGDMSGVICIDKAGQYGFDGTWMMFAPLRADMDKAFCTDSSGFSEIVEIDSIVSGVTDSELTPVACLQP